MSGFIKHKKTEIGQQSFSCGIASLDKILQMTNGSVSCIYEDRDSVIHNGFLQTFVSSCIQQNQQYFAVASEEKVLIRFGEIENNTDPGSENLTIAWRYKNLTLKDSRFKWNMLSKIPLASDVTMNTIDQLLDALRSKKKQKIAIFSLFGPLFGDFTEEVVFKLLYEIRKLARMNHHTIFMSIPQFLLKENTSVFFDNIIAIHSNLTRPHETPLYHSFIELIKTATVGSLRMNELESGRYGIVLKSKKLDVEPIDVPPDATLSSGSCTPSF